MAYKPVWISLAKQATGAKTLLSYYIYCEGGCNLDNVSWLQYVSYLPLQLQIAPKILISHMTSSDVARMQL